MYDGQAEDENLIARAQRGDRSALNALVRRHEARAYQYAFRLTRRPEMAADVVAEAFVRVLHALPNFKGQSSFATWLYRIVTNCYLDMRKKEEVRRASSLESTLATEDGDLSLQFADPGEGPHEEAERAARIDRVQEALEVLSPYQRAMLVMYHAENMSYEEIAAALDLPMGTVKSRLNRARMALREILVQDEELFRI